VRAVDVTLPPLGPTPFSFAATETADNDCSANYCSETDKFQTKSILQLEGHSALRYPPAQLICVFVALDLDINFQAMKVRPMGALKMQDQKMQDRR